MITRLCDLQDEEIINLPLDQLALHALHQIDLLPESSANGFVQTLKNKSIEKGALQSCVEALRRILPIAYNLEVKIT